MKNLNSKILSDLEVLNPSITFQNQFASIVKKVDSIKDRYRKSLADLENLYGALSQKAFKGELDLSRIPLKKEEAAQLETMEPQIQGTVKVGYSSGGFASLLSIDKKITRQLLGKPSNLN